MKIQTLKVVKKKSILLNPIGFLSIFYSYIGWPSLVVYLIALMKTRLVLPVFDWMILICLGLLFVYSVFYSGIVESLVVFRFHWGFLFFYLFFRNKTHLYGFRNLLVVLVLLTIIEGILVNSVISAVSLPNYPSADAFTHFSDVWQRAYSFGGNASVTGVLLVSILSIIQPTLMIGFGVFVAMIFVGSGSGGFAYIAYIAYRFVNSSLKRVLQLIVVIIFSAFLVYLLREFQLFSKLSFEYVSFLIELKQSQIDQHVSKMNNFELLMGTSKSSNLGGDFLWLTFFVSQGALGVILMAFFALGRINRINAFGIFIIFIMTLHYFVLFSLPGQFIAGYLFAMKSQINTLRKR